VFIRSIAGFSTCALLALGSPCALPAAAQEIREGVHNGGFEDGLAWDGARPAHWNIGFPGEEDKPAGSWAIVDQDSEAGHMLELSSVDDDGIFVSQAVDLPAGTMAGSTVTMSASLRSSGDGWTVIQLIALNPEVEPDPETEIPEVGHLILGTQETSWTTVEGEVTLTGPAEILVVILSASGAGTIGSLDHVSVAAPLPEVDPGPDRFSLRLPAGGRPAFPIGITNENPRNISNAALDDLGRDAASTVDMVNLFIHIRWNSLTGRDALDGHDAVLELAEQIEGYGLPRMITFDFTHNNLDGIGDINPRPDGTPVDRLDDPGVADAYLDELLALVEEIEPRIVSVGIETDFFRDSHPDQWTDFRSMLCDARDRIEIFDPQIHVTTYFTLSHLVAADGAPIHDGQAALRELLPCIESVGYSTYPADGTRRLADLPDGFFTAASEVAPELPLIVPEFGYRSDGVYSEEEQEAFLRRALEELAGEQVVALVWYSLNDQTYFGVEGFFQDWFRHIGLRHLDGTPKRALRLLERVHNLGRRRLQVAGRKPRPPA
jgi:hypothetical protein